MYFPPARRFLIRCIKRLSKHFSRLKPEMPCRQRNTQFFKDGRKTAWWVKHIDLPKLFPRRAASLEARSLADVPVQQPASRR
jgi:hypothetical protein